MTECDRTIIILVVWAIAFTMYYFIDKAIKKDKSKSIIKRVENQEEFSYQEQYEFIEHKRKEKRFLNLKINLPSSPYSFEPGSILYLSSSDPKNANDMTVHIAVKDGKSMNMSYNVGSTQHGDCERYYQFKYLPIGTTLMIHQLDNGKQSLVVIEIPK